MCVGVSGGSAPFEGAGAETCVRAMLRAGAVGASHFIRVNAYLARIDEFKMAKPAENPNLSKSYENNRHECVPTQ